MKEITEIKFFKPVKICRYRNCNKEISNKRIDAQFCSKNCKDCEKIYRKREKERNKS
jgi:hypothetical protein